MPSKPSSEHTPLLHQDHRSLSSDDDDDDEEVVDFEGDDDEENSRNWPLFWKYLQTFQVFAIGFVCPMASSSFAPAAQEIADEFDVSKQAAIGGQAAFVCALGIGPLFLAPMSEAFGRRKVFLLNLVLFTLMQIPTALSPNIYGFLICRVLSGLFGSVGVANGGGTLSDMFETHERAKVLGIYLTAPLLGPSIGPLIGAAIAAHASWRWIFWTSMIMVGAVTIFAFFFLRETNPTAILQQKKARLQKKNPDKKYKVEGASDQSLIAKIGSNSLRAIKILTTQPIVTTMSLYQALVFSSMYSLYAQYSSIWTSPPYNFSKMQLAWTYMGPAAGFVLTAVFIVAFIDKIYDYCANRNEDDDGQPEYRLPMANVGALFLPISLFWFGWSIEKGLNWPIPVAATLFFGGAQVSIFNTVQTYYIDAFEKNAASALAAGAFFRSMVGGIVPLFIGKLFDSLGYGWGMSVFGILSIVLMPAPLTFMKYGSKLREKSEFKG